MQPQNYLGFDREFVKRNFFPLFFGVCGLTLFVYGLMQLFTSSIPPDEIVFESEKDTSATSSGNLVVDVSGAVEKPGVYTLSTDSRVQDAIIAAGGLGQDANREWVSTRINLALKLKDGLKIYIPKIGESNLQNSQSSVLGNSQDTNQININSASQTQLDSLSGIGSVTSSKIIGGRPYTTIEELVEKKILKQSVFDKIKDQITLY